MNIPYNAKHTCDFIIDSSCRDKVALGSFDVGWQSVNMAATHVPLRPPWKKTFEALSRSRLAMPTMSLSPPSDKHRYPPPELLDTRKHRLVAEWDAMQPPPNSALVALAHRIGIAGIFSNAKGSTSKGSLATGMFLAILTLF